MLDLPIWLLNLERSPERRVFMEEQFARHGLTFEVITGVDGLRLSEADLALYSRKDALRCSERELIPGEIGCALSHVRIWQRLVDEDVEKALVFEDDILIGAMFPKILEQLHKFPSDWEMINFVTDASRQPTGDPVWDIHRVCSFTGFLNRLGAYLINRRGAEKMLNLAYPIRRPVDSLSGSTHLTGLVAYGVDPQVAALRGCHSDIHVDDSYTRVRRSVRAVLRSGFRKYINVQEYLFSKCLAEKR